jgi:hypothetical protein
MTVERRAAHRYARARPTLPGVVANDAQRELPEAFARSVDSLRPVRMRSEIRLAEAPAPQRLAPFAVALTADVLAGRHGDARDDEIATGRFVVLHDPAGQESWQGCTRVVAYVRAELEQELAADPFLAAVAWTWLTEALGKRLPPQGFRALGGTVTRVSSESYGTMATRPPIAHVELRVSWTPDDDDLAPHLEAWGDVLAAAAGLAPLPAGVAALPSRRR